MNMDDDGSFDNDNMETDNIEEPTTTAMKCIDKSQCRKCCETFLNSNKFFTRNEQLLISFRAYITAFGSVDFGNLHVLSRKFSNIFKIINFAFDKYYPQLHGEAFILDKLFSII